MNKANQTSRPVALIYAEPLLAPSMTFVRSQGEALRSFLPYYVSPFYLSHGLSLPAERIVVMHQQSAAIARITTAPFKLLGYAPRFVRRLHQLNPVLLHAHFGPMGVRALPLARALNIPMASSLLTCISSQGGVFHLWGHAWEIEELNLWHELEWLFQMFAQYKSQAAFVGNADLCTGVKS